MSTKSGAKTITLEELMNNTSEEQAKQSQQMYGNSLEQLVYKLSCPLTPLLSMELENKLDLLANHFRHAKNFYVSI